MKVYLAGPMSGIPNFNFPAFHRAAALLRANGHSVFNPAERDEEAHGTGVSASATGTIADIAHTGFTLRDALAADLEFICKEADAIAMLPGWENSKGAAAEWHTARALGLKFIYLD